MHVHCKHTKNQYSSIHILFTKAWLNVGTIIIVPLPWPNVQICTFGHGKARFDTTKEGHKHARTHTPPEQWQVKVIGERASAERLKEVARAKWS